MKVGAAVFLCLVAMTTAHPVLYGDVDGDLLPLAVEYRKPVENLQEVEFMSPIMIRGIHLRERRSPQSFDFNARAYGGGGGSLRADLNTPRWTSNNGRHSFQGNAYYQRNFNTPGPRQDWGAQATYTYTF